MVGYRPCGSVKTIARISPVTRRSRKHNIRPTTGPLPEESVIKVQYLTTVVTTMLPRMVLHRRAPSSRPDQERTTYAALHPDSHPSCQFVISRSGRYNIGRYYAVFARVRLKPSLRTMHTTNYFSGDFHPASREIKQERRST
jgi:hypothetical protein